MSVPGTWPRREYCGLLKGEETDIEGKESKQNKEGQMESLYAAAVKNRTLISYGQAKGTKKETTYDVQKSLCIIYCYITIVVMCNKDTEKEKLLPNWHYTIFSWNFSSYIQISLSSLCLLFFAKWPKVIDSTHNCFAHNSKSFV